MNAGDPGQNFRFPNYTLNPGASVGVYTNEVHPEIGGFSFGIGELFGIIKSIVVSYTTAPGRTFLNTAINL